MKYLSFKHILFSFTLLISSKLYAGSCNAYFYDLCWASRCDEYITVDLETHGSYPFDSSWNAETNSFDCPTGGCQLCGINASGDRADDCYSPFPITNQIELGSFPLPTKTTLLYNTFGFTKSCGTKNYKPMPFVGEKLKQYLGVSIPKVDGFNEYTNHDFYFDRSYNPPGYGSEYIFAKAAQVGPGGYYLLQPRIKIFGSDKVLEFYISQWGWHTASFSNLDGTYTSDYFPIYSSSFTNAGEFLNVQFQWLRWRKMIICDDYNDRDDEDGPSNWSYGADYNTGDKRFCYIKIPTWNKLYDVVQNGYGDCDANGLSGLDIGSFPNEASDSFRSVENVCKINVDEKNARDILSSGIIIPAKAGQYNFFNATSVYQGGEYSVVTEPNFNVSLAAESTYLTPKLDVQINGGDPYADSSSESFKKDLGYSTYDYQNGFFKYALMLLVEDKDFIGSKPSLCLYGCQINNSGQCKSNNKTLDDMLINESDQDNVQANKNDLLLADCVINNSLDIINNYQDYNLAITGLGIDSTYEDPRMKLTITNTKNQNENLTKIFYLRSYEDNTGNQSIPYSSISKYSDFDEEAPSYQKLVNDHYDYKSFDLRNEYYIISEFPEESIFTYLQNNNGFDIVMPFLFNNAVTYDPSYYIDDGNSNILAKPCTEFLKDPSSCSFNQSTHDTYCSNANSDMCFEQINYYDFICLYNLFNKYYIFNGQNSGEFSEEVIDSMYTTDDNLITNDYITYLNSSEYNNLDPTFPSNSQNLCLPYYYFIDTSKENFNYELNSTGINDANINIKISRTDDTERVFNAIDVPDPDYVSGNFNYNNFDINSFSQTDKNFYCNATTNSQSYDIRYDYYNKFLFKVYNQAGFIYVCYKQYDSPDSTSLPTNWEMMMAYTMDYYTGNKIYESFINLNICPDYSGSDIADFLSCPVQAAAHYNKNGEEIWCTCSSRTEWNDYSTAEQNSDWSKLSKNTVQVKAKCMMDGSWEMTNNSAYCPVYCNPEIDDIGAEMPRTLAVEGTKSSAISIECLGNQNLHGGSDNTRTYKCSGEDGEEGSWVDASGTAECKSSCPTKYFDNNNKEVESNTNYHFKLNATGLQTSSQNEDVDCEYGYSGVASATCDYTENKWINITNSCSASELTCPGNTWVRSPTNFNWHKLAWMNASSGSPNCQEPHYAGYYYYQQILDVYMDATKTHGSVVEKDCNNHWHVGLDGSSGYKPQITGTISTKCEFSGSGNSAQANWVVESFGCKANCYNIKDGSYYSPGSLSTQIVSKKGKKRWRHCEGTCDSNGSGKWTNLRKWN